MAWFLAGGVKASTKYFLSAKTPLIFEGGKMSGGLFCWNCGKNNGLTQYKGKICKYCGKKLNRVAKK